MFFHLQLEFEEFGDSITVANFDVFSNLNIYEEGLLETLEKYKDHHIFMDEVSIESQKDLDVIKKVAERRSMVSKSFWLAITYTNQQEFEEKIKSQMNDFHVFKDELSLPLRNTASIALAAYNIEKGDKINSRY